MYCINCGAKNKIEDNFCELCGTSLKKDMPPETNFNNCNKKSARKALIILLIIVIICIVCVSFISTPKNKLKYSWGTSISYIKNQEYTLEHWEYRNRLKCDDPKHTVDDLDFFEIESDNVYYFGEETSSLKSVSYSFAEEIGYAHRIEKLKSYYGNKYYVEDTSEPYYSDIIWIKGDTVIIISYASITYYDKEYFFRETPRFSDDEFKKIKRFFNI